MLRDRNTWNSLTRSQMAELDEQIGRPENHELPLTEVYTRIAQRYAERCATMLNENDLRGAMSAAEISAAAKAMVKRQAAAEENSRARIEYLKNLPEDDPLRATVTSGPERKSASSRRSYERNLKPIMEARRAKGAADQQTTSTTE